MRRVIRVGLTGFVVGLVFAVISIPAAVASTGSSEAKAAAKKGFIHACVKKRPPNQGRLRIVKRPSKCMGFQNGGGNTNGLVRGSAYAVMTDLNPGNNTFTMQYNSSTGFATTFSARAIHVISLG